MPDSKPVLHATPGDRLVVRAHHVREVERDAEILEVLGKGGGPPFLVQWQDSGRVSRVYPSSDVYIQHFEDDAHVAEPPRADAAPAPASLAAEWEAAVPPKDS